MTIHANMALLVTAPAGLATGASQVVGHSLCRESRPVPLDKRWPGDTRLTLHPSLITAAFDGLPGWVRTRCVDLFGQQDLAPNFQWFNGEQQQRILLASLRTVINLLREPIPTWWGKDEGELVDDTLVKLYPLPPRDWWTQRGITPRNEPSEEGHHTNVFYVRLMEAVLAWAADNVAAIKGARVANKLLYGMKLYFSQDRHGRMLDERALCDIATKFAQALSELLVLWADSKPNTEAAATFMAGVSSTAVAAAECSGMPTRTAGMPAAAAAEVLAATTAAGSSTYAAVAASGSAVAAVGGAGTPVNLQQRLRTRSAAACEPPRAVAPDAAAADPKDTPRQDGSAATPAGGTVPGQGAVRHGGISGERRNDAPGIRRGDDGLPLQAPGIVHHLDVTWTDIRSRCLVAMDPDTDLHMLTQNTNFLELSIASSVLVSNDLCSVDGEPNLLAVREWARKNFALDSRHIQPGGVEMPVGAVIFERARSPPGKGKGERPSPWMRVYLLFASQRSLQIQMLLSIVRVVDGHAVHGLRFHKQDGGFDLHDARVSIHCRPWDRTYMADTAAAGRREKSYWVTLDKDICYQAADAHNWDGQRTAIWVEKMLLLDGNVGRGTGTCYTRQSASANDEASPAATNGAQPGAESGAIAKNGAARGAVNRPRLRAMRRLRLRAARSLRLRALRLPRTVSGVAAESKDPAAATADDQLEDDHAMAPVAPDGMSSVKASTAGGHVILPISNDKDAPLKENASPVLSMPMPSAHTLTPRPHVPPEALYTPMYSGAALDVLDSALAQLCEGLHRQECVVPGNNCFLEVCMFASFGISPGSVLESTLRSVIAAGKSVRDDHSLAEDAPLWASQFVHLARQFGVCPVLLDPTVEDDQYHASKNVLMTTLFNWAEVVTQDTQCVFLARTGTCHVQHVCTVEGKPLVMTAAALDELYESGQLKAFHRRMTGGQAEDFVRGRHRGITHGTCPVPLGTGERTTGTITVNTAYRAQVQRRSAAFSKIRQYLRLAIRRWRSWRNWEDIVRLAVRAANRAAALVLSPVPGLVATTQDSLVEMVEEARRQAAEHAERAEARSAAQLKDILCAFEGVSQRVQQACITAETAAARVASLDQAQTTLLQQMDSVLSGAAAHADNVIRQAQDQIASFSKFQTEKLQEAVRGLRSEIAASSEATAAPPIASSPPPREIAKSRTTALPTLRGASDLDEGGGVAGKNEPPQSSDAQRMWPSGPAAGSFVLVYLLINCTEQSDVNTEAVVYLNGTWAPLLLPSFKQQLDLQSAILTDEALSAIVISEDATPSAATQALRHRLAALRLDVQGITVQETTPAVWPVAWPTPASFGAVTPKYFAFVHRYASTRVAPYVVSQHRQMLLASGKQPYTIDWVLPLLMKYSKMDTLPYDELCVLRLLISVLRDATRQGHPAGGGDFWRAPHADDVYERRGRKHELSFHKLPTQSLSSAMDEFEEGQSIMRFHSLVRHNFMHGHLQDALPQLLCHPKCFHIISRALVSRTIEPQHARLYRRVFQEQTNLRKLNDLCSRIHEVMSQRHHFPCSREDQITDELLKQFESHLAELMVLHRTLPVATEPQEMLRHEAMRLCKARCVPGTDMLRHVRTKLDALSAAFLVWGEESSQWLIAHELGHFLPNLVAEMSPSMRDRTMAAAEEYIKKVAENRSVSLAALQEQLMRSTTGAHRDAVHLLSQLRGDVLDMHGGQRTLLRFFATPHDLRRMNDLRQLPPFVHFLRRTLVGEYVCESYIHGGEEIMLQQQAATSMSAAHELLYDSGAALDVLFGTMPNASMGLYAAYEWANCRDREAGLAQKAPPAAAPPPVPPAQSGGATVRERLAQLQPGSEMPTAGDGRHAPTGMTDARLPWTLRHDTNGQNVPRLLDTPPISLDPGPRLLDTPPIPWEDVADVIRTILLEGPVRVANADDWARHGESPCWLCERRDHPLNRCYRIFRLSTKGREWARNVQVRHAGESAVTVADVCMDCDADDTLYVCAFMGTALKADSTSFERAFTLHELCHHGELLCAALAR